MNLYQIILNLASIIAAITTIIIALKKIFKKAIAPIEIKINELDKNQCKALLVEFLCDLENGERKDEEQVKLAYEIYDRYTNELKCNSYIHDKWERIMKKLRKENGYVRYGLSKTNYDHSNS